MHYHKSILPQTLLYDVILGFNAFSITRRAEIKEKNIIQILTDMHLADSLMY